MPIFIFVIISFFLFGCVGAKMENKDIKSVIKNKSMYLESFNVCNKNNIDKAYLAVDGSLFFLDIENTAIQRTNIVTGEVFCYPKKPQNYLKLSISEARNLLMSNNRIISKETRLLRNYTLNEIRKKIGEKCKDVGLSTVFLVNETNSSTIIGCQSNPEARQAIMTEITQENNDVKINMMWPQSLSYYALLINKIY